MPNITTLDPIPSNYNPSNQMIQWEDCVPNMPSTGDGVWVMPKGSLSNVSFLISKGVTHFSKYVLVGLPSGEQEELRQAGRGYDEVPKTMEQLQLTDTGADDWYFLPGHQDDFNWGWNRRIFQTPPGATEPMSEAEGANRGNNYPTVYNLYVFENSEQYYATASRWSLWRGYYSTFMPRMHQYWTVERGLPYYVAHNYFTGFSGSYPQIPEYQTKINNYGLSPFYLGDSSRGQHKAIMAADVTEYPPSDLMPGGTLALTNTTCYGVYLGAPDFTKDVAYRMIYAGFVSHKAGKYILCFIQNFYEWRPNNFLEARMPQGRFYYKNKIPHGTHNCINYALISRVFMDGLVPFGYAPKNDGNWKWNRTYYGDAMWIPNGQSTPGDLNSFPGWMQPGEGEAFASTGVEDATAFGMALYDQTFKHTKGGTRACLKYRINGGAWVTPSASVVDNVIDGFFDKKGIVFSERLGNEISVMYLNPYGTPESVTLDFEHPTNGQIYTTTVASSIAHVTRFTF